MKLKPLKLIAMIATRWGSINDMMGRALFLRKAIDKFIDESREAKINALKLTSMQWEQADFIYQLLTPIKACNDRIQGTSRAGIDKVFPVYESLFNELDRLSDVLEDPTDPGHQWMSAISPALKAMRDKLKKYYGLTQEPYVYYESMILNPRWKLAMFKQDSWSHRDLENYRRGCRTRFIDEYSTIQLDSSLTSALRGKKRKHNDEDMEDDDVYEQLFENLGGNDVGMDGNEYDTYVSAPRIKINSLQYWKENERHFPHMARMA
jgi:hypothetical protein